MQDHRMRPALLDRRAQRRVLAEQVRLPDELLERRGPHAHGQRARAIVSAGAVDGLAERGPSAAMPSVSGRVFTVEEPVLHHTGVSRAAAQMPHTRAALWSYPRGRGHRPAKVAPARSMRISPPRQVAGEQSSKVYRRWTTLC